MRFIRRWNPATPRSRPSAKGRSLRRAKARDGVRTARRRRGSARRRYGRRPALGRRAGLRIQLSRNDRCRRQRVYTRRVSALGRCTAHRRHSGVRVAWRAVRLPHGSRVSRAGRGSGARVRSAGRGRPSARGPEEGRMRVARSDFPLLARNPNLHYLDSAATSQKPRAVLDAMMRYYERDNANPHRGAYTLSARATERYHEARERIATFVGVRDAARLIFTRGTTEALNLVATAWG